MSDEISEASGFRFLFRDESPDRAVLEFDTATNPFGCCFRGAIGSPSHRSKDRQRQAELAISGQ